MHILLIPSWYSHPGAPLLGSFFKEQAESLSDGGHQVGICAPRFFEFPSKQWFEEKNSPISIQEENGITVVRASKRLPQPTPLHRIPAIYQSSVNSRKKLGLKMFVKYCEMHGTPDIIHGHSALWGGVIATAIAETHGIPLIITEHSSVIPRGIAGKRERKTAQQSYLKADKLCAISESQVVDLKNHLEIEQLDFAITPHMVDDKFTYSEVVNSDNFIWMTVGNLVDDKGHDTLLHAFSLLADEKAILWVVGDGPHRQRLEALSVDLGISERVVFHGLVMRDDMPEFFKNCHALIHPSRYETQGIVIIEALATGRPVVSTRCGGPNDVIGPDDGFLTPIDDPISLADAMKSVQEKEWDGQSISERVKQRFSRERVVQGLTEIYTAMKS